jgi:hypothetical protein
MPDERQAARVPGKGRQRRSPACAQRAGHPFTAAPGGRSPALCKHHSPAGPSPPPLPASPRPAPPQRFCQQYVDSLLALPPSAAALVARDPGGSRVLEAVLDGGPPRPPWRRKSPVFRQPSACKPQQKQGPARRSPLQNALQHQSACALAPPPQAAHRCRASRSCCSCWRATGAASPSARPAAFSQRRRTAGRMWVARRWWSSSCWRGRGSWRGATGARRWAAAVARGVAILLAGRVMARAAGCWSAGLLLHRRRCSRGWGRCRRTGACAPHRAAP